ncbi:TPA: hypothetical protein ACVU44_004730 [Vibrio parahaemolyticus]|uniref:hypothetical protein n=1 Tax=Vibrio parahaemolyticus TaxID=670 RepID=UPI000A37F02D|nr:hypothetical protein [Vibrio parahaemolyticus]MDF4628412.1 hypothetical protein [Vibrio parahaemolyticus]OUJ37944.1 hypothetical protein BTZ05_24480 [Vibrio parahaemolyticus]TOJ81528.1 hypothetical protein CGI32_19755 [Vibrio parahaemolyticus]
MAKQRYKTAHLFLKNVTELGEIFDLNRDTVRRRLKRCQVKPFKTEKGVNVYVMREAAEAILASELRGD